MNDLVAFIFSVRFFHFLFVISVIAYLVKTRLNPIIDKEILQEKELLTELTARLAQLKKAKKETVVSIEQQRLQAQRLLERITTWKHAVQKLKEQKNALQKESQETLKAFVKGQQDALLMEHFKREMAPAVIYEARQLLEKKFENITAQKTFLDRSVARMEASKQ